MGSTLKMATERDRNLVGYEVLLAVTGGIACYKSADLTSKLVQAGAGVTVVMTEAAEKFVAPLTFQALSGRQVYTSLWQRSESYDIRHISLTDSADLMIIAPATANMIAKMTAGIADNLVSSLAMSAHEACEILIAPAMNQRMWLAPPTQANMKKLADRGIHTIGPVEGRLACGTSGTGRMAEVDQIIAAAEEILRKTPP